jgi:transposase
VFRSRSKSLDVSEPALRRWIAVAKEPEGNENVRIRELEAELKKLKKENDDLKDTVDVLKKSIAIFV